MFMKLWVLVAVLLVCMELLVEEALRVNQRCPWLTLILLQARTTIILDKAIIANVHIHK